MKRGGGEVTPSSIEPLIPTMTSNTAPSGVASSSTDYSSSYQAWRAFDGTSTEWSSLGSRENQWVQYSFSYPVVVKSITYSNVRNASSLSIACKFRFQASIDGSSWVNLSNEMEQPAGGPACTGTIGLPSNTTAYANYRVYCTEGNAGLIVGEMQLYGYRTGDTTQYIYKDGIWNTAYLNPGTYTYSGAGSGWTLGSDKLSSASGVSSIIGTATTVDVANYSTLHIKAKAISGTTASVFISTQAAYPGGFIRNVSITTVGSVVDYTINVADQTAVYIGAISTDSVATEIYEIYLTE